VAEKQTVRLEFPMGGRSDRHAFQKQPPYTTVSCRNVWPDAKSRERGGSRPGFKLAFSQILGVQPVAISTISYVPTAASRIQTLLAVLMADGNLYTGANGGSLALKANMPVDEMATMCERNQKLYIANSSINQSGSSTSDRLVEYDPVTETAANVTASAGSVPEGCPCICNWRDRIVLGGGTTNPYGVFFSRQGDPTDWDYSKLDDEAAVTLGLANAGQIGEMVTALAPHADNCLVIGCPTSLWMLQGDPKSGGQVSCLSSAIGIVDRRAWCTTPDGLLVFLSHDGLYMIPAGCSSSGNPVSISREKLPVALLNIDPTSAGSGTVVSMAYDIRWRGIHIFLARRSDSVDDTGNVHYFLDWENKSLFEVQFSTAGMDPWVCCAMRSTPSSESVVICACRDGYVRRYMSTATEDDFNGSLTKKIDSYVVIGPFSDDPPLARDVRVDELDFIMANGSGSVNWNLYRGNTPEEAFANVTGNREVTGGVIGENRSFRFYPRVRGPALFLKLFSTASWAFEAATALLTKLGRTRV
jgi:hypothetical protein